MENIIYTKEEIINKINNNNIELGYTIERIADGVFEYRKVEYINFEDIVKQNREEILEILKEIEL